jgi:Uma2 family endonuclease
MAAAGGGGPGGGWWIASEVDVEYGPHEVFRHDLVGWRRDRVPERPTGRPVRTRLDWVAEILSPSNEKRDLVDKFRELQRSGVPHYWILNPAEKILVVHRAAPEGYLVVSTASAGETDRAEPFDQVELRVGVLFGDGDEDED